MAAHSYTAVGTAVTIPANSTAKSMLALFNGVGSGQVLRVYRVWVQNSITAAAVAGALFTLELRRTSAGSGGSAVTPTKHDSTASAIAAQVVVSTGQTVTVTDLIRRVQWSTDETSSVANANVESLQIIPAISYMFDVGYCETNVEPIVCREGFGVSVQFPSNAASASIGQLDAFIEFTMDTV